MTRRYRINVPYNLLRALLVWRTPRGLMWITPGGTVKSHGNPFGFGRRRPAPVRGKAPKKMRRGADPLEGNISVKEAAEILGLSRATVYNAMGAGHLQYVGYGRARRIPKAALRDFVMQNLKGGWKVGDDEGGQKP